MKKGVKSSKLWLGRKVVFNTLILKTSLSTYIFFWLLLSFLLCLQCACKHEIHKCAKTLKYCIFVSINIQWDQQPLYTQPQWVSWQLCTCWYLISFKSKQICYESYINIDFFVSVCIILVFEIMLKKGYCNHIIRLNSLVSLFILLLFLFSFIDKTRRHKSRHGSSLFDVSGPSLT